MSPCSFHHRWRKIEVAVHVYDFASGGVKKELVWLDNTLGKELSIKTEILGPDAEEVKEVRVLNRDIKWEKTGITWEADPRHAEMGCRAA